MKHSAIRTSIFMMALLVILPACANTGADSGFISGAKRRSQKETEMMSGIASTVYTVPAMELVKVRVDAEYAEDKYMDLYYPPDNDFEKKLPAVVVFNGFTGLNAKNMGRMIDWGALIAAHGMVGVTYDPVYADKDLGILLDHLVENGDSLGIDGSSLGLLCYCGTCPDGVREFRGKDRSYSESLNTGVFLYGTMPWTDDIRTDASMLIVKTGKGTDLEILDSIDDFEQKAAGANVEVRVIDYSKGHKYFDVTETPHKPWEYGTNAVFTADCDVMKDILAFLQRELLESSR